MGKLGEGLLFKYESIIPQAPTDMKFHYWEENEQGEKVLKIHTENFKLITDIEELKIYIEKCKDKLIAFDTETTGLTYYKDNIVGFSISLDEWSGFYVPIRHKIRHEVSEMVDKLDENGNQVLTKAGRVSRTKKVTVTYSEYEHNIDPKETLDVLYEILTSAKRVLMHNSEFDLNMLKAEGYDIRKIRAFDNLILPYLYDPEGTGMAGLKKLEQRVLGRTVPEFKEVLGRKCENFAEVNPEDGYVYACYDRETEVLTEYGWVKWGYYDGVTKLATVNLESGLLEYQKPTKLYKYKYEGKMECCKSQSIDYCVTPNHKMVVAYAQDPKKGWLLKRADELNTEETAMTAPANIKHSLDYIEINGNKYDSKVMAQIAALVLADGYCRIKDKKCYTICISTSFEKNYEEIESILYGSPFKWTPYKSNNKKVLSWECWDKDLWEWLSPYGGHGALNKKVPTEIFSVSKESIEAFLRAYSITDGHNYPSGATRYYTVSKQMVDDLQRLLLMAGKRSSVYSREPKDCTIEGRLVKKENCHTIYHIKTTGDKTTRYKKRNRFQVDYNDFVYCAEVPNHTLITRRNGSTLVAGNCCDTSGLIGVYKKMFPMVKDLLKQFKSPLSFDGEEYNVMVKDNQMVKMFVDYYGHCKILIDRQKALKYKENLENEQKRVTKEIYDYFGVGIFNLARSKEFAEVMASKKVFTGVKTNKGEPSWSKTALGDMKKNITKLKECMKHYKEVSFIDGKLNKSGWGFTLASLLEIYGKECFRMTSTIKTLTVKGLKGETIDRKLFWLTVKDLYLKEQEKVHILDLIQKNNSLNKALNSYVDKLTQVDECIMHYRLKGTKSGRLSSGNGSKSDKSKNHYYIDLNAQNLTKPKSGYYRAEECPSEDPEGILGWKFTPLSDDYALSHLEDEYIVEGQDPNPTIRGCLKAPEGRYVVSLDYDAQEYKLMAILSRDHQMLENFYNGIDPHTASAYAIWGEENYNKQKRKKAKIFNFLNNYSGGAHTLAQQLDISVDEAQEMIDKYNETFFEMYNWKLKEIDKMYYNQGVVFNAFGRPRNFKGWIDVIDNTRENYDDLLQKQSAERAADKVKGAVERRVSSHIIQGTAGDILRLVLYRLYKRYFKNRDPHIDFMSTVHDEINYTIDKEVAVDYIRELEQLMTFDTLDKTLPITTSTDIGFTYGNMFPFVWKDETKQILIPKRVHHA